MEYTRFSKLEDLVPFIGNSTSIRGRNFEALCAGLIQEMGFNEVYRRKGSEQGRDIDAKYGETNWFFECKCYTDALPTPEVAYKFLQLDMLSRQLIPDYLVIISNANINSILKDLVTFRNRADYVRYLVFCWANETSDQTFNRILLSYPNAYLSYLSKHIDFSNKMLEELIADFESRAKYYSKNNAPFFNEFIRSLPPTRKVKGDVPNLSLAKYLLNDILEEMQDGPMKWGKHFELVTVGMPTTPMKVYDFNDTVTIKSLQKRLKPWGVEFISSNPKYLEFQEAFGPSTIFYSNGAIAIISDIFAMNDVVEPSEWLGLLREDSLRMRNFMKRGMLLTPCIMKTSIVDFLVNLAPHGWHLASLKSLARGTRNATRKGKLHFTDSLISSDDILFDYPPDKHEDIARSIVPSLWKNAGFQEDFLGTAKELIKRVFRGDMLKKMSAEEATTCLYEVSLNLGWLVFGENRDRSYKVFDDMLSSAGIFT